MLADAVIDTENPDYQYQVFVDYYTRRALTSDADTLRAMAGVLRRLSQKFRCRMLHGLPTGLFDRFILLRGPAAGRRRGFPSYSWAGWRRPLDFFKLEFLRDIHDWLLDRTWIVWYKRSPTGVVSLVWESRGESGIVPGDWWYGYSGLRSPAKPV
jgi:hypothetical protein